MLQKTHSLAGILAAECAIVYYHQPLLSWESGAAMLLGCLIGPLADVDKKGSTMARIFMPLAGILQLLRIKHRTMTHSLICLVGLAVLLSSLPPFFKWTCLLAYASHPLIDLFNEKGVALLWPWNRRFRLVPSFLAIRTGSAQETLFSMVLLSLMVAVPFIYL
jgi:inner membrane protein